MTDISDPDEQFSARLRADGERWQADVDAVPSQGPRLSVARPPERRRQRVPWLVAAAVVVLVGSVYGLVVRRPHQEVASPPPAPVGSESATQLTGGLPSSADLGSSVSVTTAAADGAPSTGSRETPTSSAAQLPAATSSVLSTSSAAATTYITPGPTSRYVGQWGPEFRCAGSLSDIVDLTPGFKVTVSPPDAKGIAPINVLNETKARIFGADTLFFGWLLDAEDRVVGNDRAYELFEDGGLGYPSLLMATPIDIAPGETYRNVRGPWIEPFTRPLLTGHSCPIWTADGKRKTADGKRYDYPALKGSYRLVVEVFVLDDEMSENYKYHGVSEPLWLEF